MSLQLAPSISSPQTVLFPEKHTHTTVHFEEDLSLQTPNASYREEAVRICCTKNIIPRFFSTVISVAMVGIWIIKSNIDVLNKMEMDVSAAANGCNFNATCFNATSQGIFNAAREEQNHVFNNAYLILLCATFVLMTSVPIFNLTHKEDEDPKPLRVAHFAIGTAAFGAGIATTPVFPISGPLLAFSGGWTALNSITPKQWVRSWSKLTKGVASSQ